jgi:hypothetical protein
MQAGTATYDATLQMFVERPHEADAARLGFLRWLAEHGRLEHAIAGLPSGEYALHAHAAEPRPLQRERRSRSQTEGRLTRRARGTSA